MSSATTNETSNSSTIPIMLPEGLLEAKVAFTTSETATTVMYQRRAFDQFLGSVGRSISHSISQIASSRNAYSRYHLAKRLTALGR